MSHARRARPTPAPASPGGEPPRPVTLFLLLLGVVLIGYFDLLTGPDIAFSLFYLLPIVATAQALGKWHSVLVSAMAAVAWFMADPHNSIAAWASLWNGFTRLVIFLGVGWLVGRLHEDRRREAELARLDPTTGLPNSRAFKERLTELTAHTAPYGLAYIDLDNFKRVNDLFGHTAGDAVLVEVAAALRRATRREDITARVGGDEFAVLMTHADQATAELIGRRIAEIAQQIGTRYPGTDFGASVGVALSATAMPPDALIRIADEAMYEAKARRKGSCVVRQAGARGHAA